MRVFTAIDLAGRKYRQLDEQSVILACPWCGADAWAAADYLQCGNGACAIQVAESMDILARHCGGYKEADAFAAKRLKRNVDPVGVARREIERKVMSLWIEFCSSPMTVDACNKFTQLENQGLGLRHSRAGVRVLDSEQIQKLIKVGVETGATMPDSWLENPPRTTMAAAIQTRPHTIDRIILWRHKGLQQDIVWNSYSAGFCGLIGLTTASPRLLTVNAYVALKLQQRMAAEGRREEVAFIHADQWFGGRPPHWEVRHHLLTACPRAPIHNKDEHDLAQGLHDLAQLQWVVDQFPGLESLMPGVTVQHILSGKPKLQHAPWRLLRRSYIYSLIPKDATRVTATAASIFELTGSKSADVAALVEQFKAEGRHQLVEDFVRLSMHRTIFQDRHLTVRETSNEYQMLHNAGVVNLTNFSLTVQNNVSFPNFGNTYCQSTLRCGDTSMDVMLPQSMIQDRVHNLQDELQRQIAAAKQSSAGRLPTIIETGKFRQYVLPYLRKQIADASTVVGIDRLGWSSDRRTFNFPGFTATEDGLHKASKILCPNIPVLKLFHHVDGWSESFQPNQLDVAGRDMVAMILASCVRYYRLCTTQPIMVTQTSDAALLLDALRKALGQHTIFELGQNNRDGSRVPGVFGYPIFAAGPRSASLTDGQTPYFHLTDRGYRIPSSPTPEQARTAGRAAQCALLKVVNWCLSSGADAFGEIASLQHHSALMREGRWLLENVCEVEDWQISEPDSSAIERLLGQIPYAEAGRRITLIDGTNLVIDIHGLTHDHDAILREARDMGTVVALEGHKLVAPAIRLFPAISTYYGQTPDVTTLVTDV